MVCLTGESVIALSNKHCFGQMSVGQMPVNQMLVNQIFVVCW
jgi:hypothetical protein